MFRFSPIYRLLMQRITERVREAEAAFKARRKELKQKLKDDTAKAAEDLVDSIIKF